MASPCAVACGQRQCCSLDRHCLCHEHHSLPPNDSACRPHPAGRLRYPPDQSGRSVGRQPYRLPVRNPTGRSQRAGQGDEGHPGVLRWGPRAAAFSYGILEFLKRTEIKGPKGNTIRLIDSVDIITGVSGGSFTALAYGLYGDKLFDSYDDAFLKRNIQGEIISRTFSPASWTNLLSAQWGRSELAANLYDEVLFKGATFGDLQRDKGPMILASATDLSTGSRFVFTQAYFDLL